MVDAVSRVEVPRPDAESARIVQQSVAHIGGHAAELAGAFYDHLFAMLPDVRALFPADMAAQHERLLQALLSTVDSLHDPAAMEGRLQQLGAAHYGRGIREDEYQYAAHALVRALRDLDGGAWSTRMSSAWMSVYSWMIAHMVAGARSARLLVEVGQMVEAGRLAEAGQQARTETATAVTGRPAQHPVGSVREAAAHSGEVPAGHSGELPVGHSGELPVGHPRQPPGALSAPRADTGARQRVDLYPRVPAAVTGVARAAQRRAVPRR